MSEKHVPSELSALLCEAGYEVGEGKDAVLSMIHEKAGLPGKCLCSGYGVFPGGEKCGGCSDCT